MRHASRLFLSLLPGFVFAAAVVCAAQPQPPATATTAEPAAAPAAPAPAPAPTPAPAPAIDRDLLALGEKLAQERRMLKADGHEFAVFVTAARTPATLGTLLLIPGDGSHPTSAAGLEQIRLAMPAHGWATWLLTLEPPPRSHAEKIGTPDGSPPAAAGPATAGEAPATLDDQRAAALEHWAARSQARIIAAIASAAAEGRPLALVAEGSSAVLLTRGMGSTPGAVRAAALLDPVELPGLALAWPKGLARPVMEVLSPAASHEQGRLRREQAAARQLENYRQLTLETGSWQPGAADAPLTRRLRGWLTTLDRTPGATPDDG
jgi:hypothetical protein